MLTLQEVWPLERPPSTLLTTGLESMFSKSSLSMNLPVTIAPSPPSSLLLLAPPSPLPPLPSTLLPVFILPTLLVAVSLLFFLLLSLLLLLLLFVILLLSLLLLLFMLFLLATALCFKGTGLGTTKSSSNSLSRWRCRLLL